MSTNPMPQAEPTSLDHIGIIVPSLADAAALFTSLGFTLTARADHTRTNDQGEVESAGSAQHSIMFEHGYIEVQEITDPQQRHLLSPAAAKHFGAHIVAFGETDAAAANLRVRTAGLPVGPVLDWGRPVYEPGLSGMARFAFFGAPYATEDESYLCWVQHLTPEILRSDRLVTHANGARELAGILVAARDTTEVARIAARYQASGATLIAASASNALLRAGRGTLDVRLADTLPREMAGGLATPALTGSGRIVALVIRADDPAAIAGLARQAGLAVADTGKALAIDLGAVVATTLLIAPAQ